MDDSDCVTVATGPAPAPDAPKDQIECSHPPQTNFLHSPPDSNNAIKTDASDSELSELEDEPALDGPHPMLSASADADPDAEPPKPDAQVDDQVDDDQDDIGEVLPDHWSGTVPVFKPTMDQFKDFKKFVRHAALRQVPLGAPTHPALRSPTNLTCATDEKG